MPSPSPRPSAARPAPARPPRRPAPYEAGAACRAGRSRPAAVANLFYYRGVAAVGPASASLMMFTVPVFGSFCAYVFLGESLGPVQTAGAVVLLAGGLLAAMSGAGRTFSARRTRTRTEARPPYRPDAETARRTS
ncbi:DMT family transporter [Streptomyces sp. NPDC000410]|uniref:DMT family transporter n=1 Tax=Streptomyces sp. NPDC000410 TaxID=3154254 RepID=UPI003330AB99